MLIKTSHDLSIRFDIELFPRGSSDPPIDSTVHRDIAAISTRDHIERLGVLFPVSGFGRHLC
jgi:hypothetical protein